MKKILACFVLSVILNSMANAQQNKPAQLLRHVVMFGWKAGAETTAINKIVAAFKELPGKIALIKAFEYGTNNSPEGLNKGLTHCFLLTFDSEADRDAYLIHPDHKAFVSKLQPAPDNVTVLDYRAQQ